MALCKVGCWVGGAGLLGGGVVAGGQVSCHSIVSSCRVVAASLTLCRVVCMTGAASTDKPGSDPSLSEDCVVAKATKRRAHRCLPFGHPQGLLAGGVGGKGKGRRTGWGRGERGGEEYGERGGRDGRGDGGGPGGDG